MADNEALITQFMDVTGAQRDRAEFYLQSANFSLDVAVSNFFEHMPDEVAPEIAMSKSSDSSDEDNNVVISGRSKKNNQNFATLSSVQNTTEDSDEDKGQAFYAGGSEHSGLQVLGPPKKKNPIKDMVSEVFKQAQAGNLEQMDSSQESDSPSFRSFTGVGYRLGQTEDDSRPIPSSSSARKKHDDHESVVVKVFKQGFTVDDGDLRSYEDPRNREFFESITRNEIPQELKKQGKAMVHVNVENHLSEEYVKKAPKFKAFTGTGQTLGSPAPVTTADVVSTSSGDPKVSNAEKESKAAENLNVDQNEPTTNLSIRLTDGSRLSARFNLTHTIQDIHQYIVTSRPEYSGRSFVLLTTFPNKELTNTSETIKDAGLQNAAILQRLK